MTAIRFGGGRLIREEEEGARPPGSDDRGIAELSTDRIARFDGEGVCLYANSAANIRLGLRASERIGGSWAAREPAATLQRAARSVLESGRGLEAETEIRTPEGPRRVRTRCVPEGGKDGRPRSVLCFQSDLPDAREGEKQFQLLIRRLPIPVSITDGGGRFLSFNDRFQETFGYTLEDIPDIATWWLRAYPDPEYRQQVQDVWRYAVDNGRWDLTEPKFLVYRVTCRNGSVRDMEIIGTRIGPMVLYLFRDVTENRRTEEALAGLREQLFQAQKMEAIGRLAGGVAHDFNNILTAVLGFSNLIRTESGLSESVGKYVGEIEKATRRAADLTRQLLAFGRKQMLQPRVIDLNSLVTNLQGMLQRLIGEDIRLVSRLDREPPCTLADPGQIEQVITNLVVNARDAMQRGGTLTLETRNPETGPPSTMEIGQDRFVILSVIDTGCGMDEKVRSHLFEPFFTTKEKGKGTGLGLSTAYGIVKQSGGHITVSSEPGKGSCFSLYLPRVRGEKGRPAPARESAAPLRQGTETVLLVEDEENLLAMTAKVLERLGYHVIATQDPGEALARLGAIDVARVDLLITDVVMPGLSGPELADRAVALRPGMKVLFVSGHADETIQRMGVRERGVAFLQKPFTPDALAQKVRQTLGG